MWWLCAALVAVVITSLWFWINSGEVKAKLLLEDGSCHIRSIPKLADDKPSIVALGTSLLMYSTEPTKNFAASLQGLSWTPCRVSAGLWGDLVRALPSIAALTPKVLIVQEGVLTDSGPSYDVQKLFANVVFMIKAKLGWTQPVLNADHPLCGLWKHANVAAHYHPLLKPQSAIFAEATIWIRQLEAAGIHVIVLDIPRAAALESQLGPVLLERRLALQKLASDTGAEYWAFDPPSDPQAYCADQAHMTVDGRNQFAPQLAKRLQQYFVSPAE